jgi:hypothetical protein
LNTWRYDPDLAAIREKRLLATLPLNIQNAANEFWQRLDDVVRVAEGD